jgi:hypothetical protein
MKDGTIVKWLKAEGETVEKGKNRSAGSMMGLR